MTAIIGIKDGKKIIVGSDGRTSTETDGWAIREKSSYKVQRVNGSPNCLIACSGNVDSIFVVHNIKNLLGGKNDVTYKYMVNVVVPKIYDALEKSNLIKKTEKYNMINVYIIVGTKSHLYKITTYGVVSECSNVAIAGSGEDMLLCKYQAIKDKKISAREKVIQCVKHAIEYGQSIGYPITLASTDSTDEIEVIEEKRD